MSATPRYGKSAHCKVSAVTVTTFEIQPHEEMSQ